MKKQTIFHLGVPPIASVLCLFLLAACNSSGLSETTPIPVSTNTPALTATPRASATPRPTATPKAASNAALLKAATANMKSASSYTLYADVEQSGQAVKLNGMIDTAANATKMDIEVAGQRIALISIGNDVYLSIDEGANYMNAGSSGSSITEGFDGITKMWDSFDPGQIDKAGSALKDGSPAIEKIDGVDCKHITVGANALSLLGGSTGGAATEGILDLWISTDKPYVRQMKIDGTSDGQTTKGTLKWGRFNEKFDIKAP